LILNVLLVSVEEVTVGNCIHRGAVARGQTFLPTSRR
jgi:hypothetical protein